MAIWRRVGCWINKATNAQAHARAREPTHTHKHALTHKRAHARTQKCEILIAFPRQQWLGEGASLLRYTYIGPFVLIY
jgi:hypothetical protein